MLEVTSLVIQFAIGIILTVRLLRWDEGRLPAEMLERAWNPASFWIAVVVFGPLCLPVHFIRTRRSLWGATLGLLSLLALMLVQALVAWPFQALSGNSRLDRIVRAQPVAL